MGIISRSGVAPAELFTAGLLDAPSGFKRQAWDRAMNVNTISPTTQDFRATAIGLDGGTVVTSVVTFGIAAGTANVHGWLGIYNAAFQQLAISADTPASFNQNGGYLSLPMTSPLTIPSSGLYYAIMLSQATTVQTFAGLAAVGGDVAFGANAPRGFIQAAQATPPATATPSGTNSLLWFAVA